MAYGPVSENVSPATDQPPAVRSVVPPRSPTRSPWESAAVETTSETTVSVERVRPA